MKRNAVLFLIFISAFSQSFNLFGASNVHSSISVNEMCAEMEFICDTLIAGRQFGSPKSGLVSMYILRQFRDNGLRATVQSFRELDKVGHNVVAFTPGYYKNYIVISAYYDGLGVLDGKIYTGADSNASGVATLLCLASRLQPKGETGFIFLALDGHNASMSGSKAFVQEYTKEYSIKQVVNLDILGSDLVPVHKNRKEYLIALGGISMMTSLDRVNRNFKFDLCYDYYGSSSFTELFYEKISDQHYFLLRGIPAIMFTSGITNHTNKTTDTLDNINFELLTKRANFILSWLQSL